MKLIVFSGGLDSTCMLSREFQFGTDKFDTCYIPIHNNRNQMKREIRARTKILERLKDMYPNNRFKKDREFTFAEGEFSCTSTVALKQAYIFLTTLIWNIGSDYDKVEFGFVRFDNFWHYKSEFLDSFKSLYAFANNNKSINIGFPIEWSYKEDLIKELTKIDLYQLITYCQEGKRTPCGICGPCTNHPK